MKPTDILFKAKRKDNGEWVEGFYRPIVVRERRGVKTWIEHEISVIHNDTILEFGIDPSTLCMWTTLNDKNGKKVFSGDVLQTEQGIAFVIWCDAAFALKSPGSNAIDYEHSSVYESSEIIGNIHDNPELIEETK